MNFTLETIETEINATAIPLFTFSATAKQNYKVKYTATLLSPDDTVLFKIDGREESESLDELTEIIGEYIGKRVARFYN